GSGCGPRGLPDLTAPVPPGRRRPAECASGAADALRGEGCSRPGEACASAGNGPSLHRARRGLAGAGARSNPVHRSKVRDPKCCAIRLTALSEDAAMWRHNLTMAIRGLLRHRLYSFLNVFGLSVALVCAILILLYVRDQLSYDAWLPGAGNLYRLEVTAHPPGGEPFVTAGCPFPVLSAVGGQIPLVQATTHVVPESMTVTAGHEQALERVTVVDPGFLQIIQLPLRQGSPAHVLAQPESVVLSESMARKYFGDIDPIGKTIKVSGVWPDKCKADEAKCYFAVHTLTVTGVLKDLPHNTQLVADFLMPNTSSADELPQSDKTGGWNGVDGDYRSEERRVGK